MDWTMTIWTIGALGFLAPLATWGQMGRGEITVYIALVLLAILAPVAVFVSGYVGRWKRDCPDSGFSDWELCKMALRELMGRER